MSLILEIYTETVLYIQWFYCCNLIFLESCVILKLLSEAITTL